jgi:hypothetical protein
MALEARLAKSIRRPGAPRTHSMLVEAQPEDVGS